MAARAAARRAPAAAAPRRRRAARARPRRARAACGACGAAGDEGGGDEEGSSSAPLTDGGGGVEGLVPWAGARAGGRGGGLVPLSRAAGGARAGAAGGGAHAHPPERPGQGEGEPPTGLVPLLGRSGADAVVFRAAGAPPPGAIDPAGGAADGLTGGARGDGADGLTSAPWDLTALAKPSASQRRTSLLRFTCETCGALNFHMVNPRAFASGTIFARCSSCGITHTVVDHLNLVWTGEEEEEDAKAPPAGAGDAE